MREPLPFGPTAETRSRWGYRNKYGSIILRGANEDTRRRWARRAILTFPEGTRVAVWFADRLAYVHHPANLPADARPEVEVVCELVVGKVEASR